MKSPNNPTTYEENTMLLLRQVSGIHTWHCACQRHQPTHGSSELLIPVLGRTTCCNTHSILYQLTSERRWGSHIETKLRRRVFLPLNHFHKDEATHQAINGQLPNPSHLLLLRPSVALYLQFSGTLALAIGEKYSCPLPNAHCANRNETNTQSAVPDGTTRET